MLFPVKRLKEISFKYLAQVSHLLFKTLVGVENTFSVQTQLHLTWVVQSEVSLTGK